MGVKGLMTFLISKYPKIIVEETQATLANKTLAIDVSSWLYQFIIKCRNEFNGPSDSEGNATGHLIGLMSRVEHCFKNNIHAIYVFDGKPPAEKFEELKRRAQRREQAENDLENLRELADQERIGEMMKKNQISASITKAEIEDAKKLLKLIGLPVIESPSEAEPQCAYLVRQGLAYASVSEDMDCMAYNTPRMIRNFLFLLRESHQNKKYGKSSQTDQKTIRKERCYSIELQTILQNLELTHDQFIEFCILLGCDYSSKIKGIGPNIALSLLKKHQNIDKILEYIADSNSKKFSYDDTFNHYAARNVFKNPKIKQFSNITQKCLGKRSLLCDNGELIYQQFNEEALRQFLERKEFSEVRVNNWIHRATSIAMFRKYLMRNM